jgi:hypothetical protein
LRSFQVFVFGAVYLVSGIYSLGLSLFMEGKVMPVSGYTAYVTAPDALFPYEVALFTIFGVLFIIASFFEFRKSVRLMGQSQILQAWPKDKRAGTNP